MLQHYSPICPSVAWIADWIVAREGVHVTSLHGTEHHCCLGQRSKTAFLLLIREDKGVHIHRWRWHVPRKITAIFHLHWLENVPRPTRPGFRHRGSTLWAGEDLQIKIFSSTEEQLQLGGFWINRLDLHSSSCSGAPDAFCPSTEADQQSQCVKFVINLKEKVYTEIIWFEKWRWCGGGNEGYKWEHTGSFFHGKFNLCIGDHGTAMVITGEQWQSECRETARKAAQHTHNIMEQGINVTIKHWHITPEASG